MMYEFSDHIQAQESLQSTNSLESEILLEVGNLQSQRAHPLKPCKTPRVKIQKSILATKDFLLWVLTLGFILCVKPPSASHEMTLVLGSICFEAQFGCF